MYLAYAGPESVESGATLPDLIAALGARWDSIGEDVVVWYAPPGESCRVAAVLRDAPGGRPQVLRFCHGRA